MYYYNMTSKEVIAALASSLDSGLTSAEAEARLAKFGKNRLEISKKITIWHRLFNQFKELMIIILIVASILAFFMGESVDASIILFIVILNAIIGVFQEYKAEKAVEALKKMMSLQATIIRDGTESIIDAENLVSGDILILEEGTKIPADVRIIESAMLKVDEAILTGESVPRNKSEAAIKDDEVALADRSNILFMGTTISSGRCKAIVLETGMKTEFGKIAGLTTQINEDKSPLQKELDHVGKFIAKLALVICLFVFALGIFEGRNMFEMFLFAISLGVAAVPEGLPATMTISLALGVQRMAKRRAIIRRLASVETLGSTTIICTDKTGTLTKNEMTVKRLYVSGKVVDVEGEGYEPSGKFLNNNNTFSDHTMMGLLRNGLLCNNACLKKENSHWSIVGDPTEGALLVSAEKAGLSHKAEEENYRRIFEIPFSSERRTMITVHRIASGKKNSKENILAYMKGAPDMVLDTCTHIEINGKIKKLTSKDKVNLRGISLSMSNDALRVLGFAYKHLKGAEAKNCQKLKDSGFIFQGLQGMIDPPRLEVKEAVAKCRAAGIKIFVITGDNGLTARAIAKQIGIATDLTKIITGLELDKISDEQLIGELKEEVIFARVTAEHKMRIVNAVKKQGVIVAVTGDGVNDAPALKRADIGVAMGITGTDVSKEASQMVLTDDSFATIVNAIEEGRTIYSNITKFIKYMFSSNLGEVMAILIAMLLMPGTLLVSAIAILWVNLGTDVLPALALGLEPVEKGIMTRPPRNPKERLINSKNVMDWLVTGFIIGAGTVLIYILNIGNPAKAMTMAFTLLVFYQLANVFNCRNDTKSLFELKPFSNRYLLVAVLISALLQIAVVNVGFMQSIFRTTSLSLNDWLMIIIFSLSVVFYEEVNKLLIKLKNRKKETAPQYAMN